jgi:hypothetical protein
MNARFKSVLIFLLKLVVTAVPAYFVYRNIVMAPDWSVDDLYRLFSTHSVWPLFVALLCLGLSNFTACLQWKLLLEKQNVNGLDVASKVKIYQMSTDLTLPPTKAITQQAERESLYESLDLANAWLQRAKKS